MALCEAHNGTRNSTRAAATRRAALMAVVCRVGVPPRREKCSLSVDSQRSQLMGLKVRAEPLDTLLRVVTCGAPKVRENVGRGPLKMELRPLQDPGGHARWSKGREALHTPQSRRPAPAATGGAPAAARRGHPATLGGGHRACAAPGGTTHHELLLITRVQVDGSATASRAAWTFKAVAPMSTAARS